MVHRSMGGFAPHTTLNSNIIAPPSPPYVGAVIIVLKKLT